MDLRSIVAAAPEVALGGTVLRLVQQQGINSLEPLVDNLEQLARLEAMVASSKPPLRHGSRFGSRQYRGIFYGSRSRSGCLVEGAYYGLLFWEGLIDPPAAPIRRRQTLFSVLLNASRGLRLQAIAADAAQSACGIPSPTGPPNSSAPGCAIKELGPLNTSAPAPGMRWCKWVSSARRCFSPLPSIRWKSAPKSRQITRLSCVMTTASCIVLGASCF